MSGNFIDSNDNRSTVELSANKEFHVFPEGSEGVCITLLDGDAEILRESMVPNVCNRILNYFVVVTKTGCRLKFEGTLPRTRTASHNAVAYNIHRYLERKRSEAAKSNGMGPIVLIAGPTDVGKSTLCDSLLRYAALEGRSPAFIDLDVGQSSTSIPGTLAIFTAERSEKKRRFYKRQFKEVYFFGYISPGHHIQLYLKLISKMRSSLWGRMEQGEKYKHSGAIIDTCGWITGGGFRSIVHAAHELGATIVYVLDDTPLYENLKGNLPVEAQLVFMDKLRNAVVKTRTFRIHNRERLVRKYFYGENGNLATYNFELKFSDIKIVQCSRPNAESTRNLNSAGIHAVNVDVGPQLENQVMALCYSDTAKDELLTECVMGFVFVKAVDTERGTITFLSPKPKPLPNNIFILGDIVFQDN